MKYNPIQVAKKVSAIAALFHPRTIMLHIKLSMFPRNCSYILTCIVIPLFTRAILKHFFIVWLPAMAADDDWANSGSLALIRAGQKKVLDKTSKQVTRCCWRQCSTYVVFFGSFSVQQKPGQKATIAVLGLQMPTLINGLPQQQMDAICSIVWVESLEDGRLSYTTNTWFEPTLIVK